MVEGLVGAVFCLESDVEAANAVSEDVSEEVDRVDSIIRIVYIREIFRGLTLVRVVCTMASY